MGLMAQLLPSEVSKKILAVSLCLTVWTIAIGVSDLFALHLCRVKLSLSWLNIVAPVATVVIIDPWSWIVKNRYCCLPYVRSQLAYFVLLIVVIILWTSLVLEVNIKVIEVRLPIELNEHEIQYVYDNLKGDWSYNPKSGVIYIRRQSSSSLTQIKEIRRELLLKRRKSEIYSGAKQGT